MTKLPSLGVNFWQFQKDYLKDDSRFIAVLWARGNGKSKITALKIALDVFDCESKDKRSDWLIVSASAPQAQEALRLVEAWSKVIYQTAVALNIIEEEVEVRTEEGLIRYTRYRLRLGRSSQVIALSASPSAVRGYTSNCFLDELAFFPQGQEFFNAAQHVTRGRLKLIVASTPIGGSENVYHKIMHNTAIVRGKPLWSKHIADIHRAIADGRVYDLQAERAAADPYSFKSELLLEWSDSPNTWFSSELIAACEDARASAVGHGYNRGRCFIGNDVGLRHDKWCAFVLEATEDFGVHIEDCPNGQKISYYTGELITREVVVLDRSSFAEHDRQIARLFAKYNVIRMAIDRTGMGERSTEEYQNLYGSKVEGVNFTTDTKGNMATLGLELMTERRVLLPQDHPEIGADFRKLQRVVSAGGNVRFQAARDNSGHGDVVWSFLLACNAAWTPQTPVEVKSSGESAQEQNIMAGWTTGLEGMRSGR
jgi:phage FluMu gp28-like protein